MNVDIKRVSSGWGKRLFCLDCYYGLFDAFPLESCPLVSLTTNKYKTIDKMNSDTFRTA